MATTGVPNQLYQGTDAPDLVHGAYAGHTHQVDSAEDIQLQTVGQTCCYAKIKHGNYFLYIVQGLATETLQLLGNGAMSQTVVNIALEIPENERIRYSQGFGTAMARTPENDTYGFIPIHLVSAQKASQSINVTAQAALKNSDSLKVSVINYVLFIYTTTN